MRRLKPKAVATLLGTVAATNAEASETRLGNEAAGSKVLHLAAHGGYNVVNPLFSAIYLAPDGAGTAGDGRPRNPRGLRPGPEGQ